MLKLIKSMLYRAAHDVFFYIAILICIGVTILFVNNGGAELKNHAKSQYDENITVSYEEEDSLNVHKHLVAEDLIVHNVPGRDIVYRDSLNNVMRTDYLTVIISVLVLIIALLYSVIFYGEMFSKGAIRNMIAAGITKGKIFITSVIVFMVFLTVFAAASGVAAAIFVTAADMYPLIHVPSLIVFLLAELLVGTLAGTMVILIVFITQRPLKSILVLVACVTVFGIVNNTLDITGAFDWKYDIDNKAFNEFLEDSERHDSGFEWYLPVSGFNLFGIYKDDGSLYKDFSTDELNPDYSGDTKVAVLRVLWRLNVAILPMEASVFYVYPLCRDGVLMRYIAVASVYEIIIIAAGFVVVKKRNIC